MSLERLRTVLQSSFQVRLESTPAVVGRLNTLIAACQKMFTDRGLTPPPSKQAAAVDSIGSRDWTVRPIDLLHKIGNLTTPARICPVQPRRSHSRALSAGTEVLLAT